MNTARIISKIQQKLQDETYSRDELLADLNDALLLIASIFPLPSLQVSDIIIAEADTNSVDLPVDFLNNLYRVENISTEQPCKVVFNHKVLGEMFDGLAPSGDITHVTAENGVLHVRKQPTESQDLLLYYNKKPDELSDDDYDEPACIPIHLHDLLLVSYVMYDKYSEIENGLERNYNTVFYWTRFENAFNLLAAFYPSVSQRNEYQRFLVAMRPTPIIQQAPIAREGN